MSHPPGTPEKASVACPKGGAAVFWLSFWMAIALIGAKVAFLGWPSGDSADRAQHLRNVVIVSHEDLLFVVGMGFMAGALMTFAARWRSVHKTAVGLMAVLFLTIVLYAVASVFAFQVLRAPLTYSLLYMANDMVAMRSSVWAYVTPSRVAFLVGVPISYALLVWGSIRVCGKLVGWRGLCVGLALIGVYVAYGRSLSTRYPWQHSDVRRIIDNPHWALIQSCIREWTTGGVVTLAGDYPKDELRDFQTIAERGHALAGYIGPHPKNVILIVLESVGKRYLSFYGSPYHAMPNLERELADSLLIDGFYSHIQNTSNSLVAIDLSTYPGVSWKSVTIEAPKIHGTSLAQLLKGNGYRTAYFTAGDNSYMNMEQFLDGRGFDTIKDCRTLGGRRLSSWGTEDRVVFDEIIKFIDAGRGPENPPQPSALSTQDSNRPFFIMTWNIQSHHPYTPSPETPRIDFFPNHAPIDAKDLGNYLNVLQQLDTQIASLFSALRSRGLDKETAVIITGDHGEAFGEPHGTYAHAANVYDEDVGIPLLIWWPGLANKGARLQRISGHIDLNPTITDLLALAPAPTWQGQSVFSPTHPGRAYLYGASEHLVAVCEGDWKYIVNTIRGEEELYNLAIDPDEQQNVAASNRELCGRLRQRLAAWVGYEGKHLTELRGH